MSSPDDHVPTSSDLWDLSNEIEGFLTRESIALRVWEADKHDVFLDLDYEALHWFLGWLQKQIGDTDTHIALKDRSRVYAAALDIGLWLRETAHLPIKKTPLSSLGDISGRLGLLLSAINDAYSMLCYEESIAEADGETGIDG